MVSEAQKRFLRRKFAKEREEETGCDCPGCDKCKGFVRNCTCDHDLEWLKLRHGNRMEDLETDRDSEPNMGGRNGIRNTPKENEFPF